MDAYLPAHAGDRQLRIFGLVEIQFSGGTVRWTTSDARLLYGGQWWEPKTVILTTVKARQGTGDAATTSLTIGDADQLVSDYINGATSPMGSLVILREAWLDPTAPNVIVQGAKVIFKGRIVGAHGERAEEEMRGVFELKELDLSKKRVPAIWLGPKCPYVYQDEATCGATGAATSCDHTFDGANGCAREDKVDPPAAGGNRERYGGERWLPPDGTVITWGDGKTTIRTAPRKTIGA